MRRSDREIVELCQRGRPEGFASLLLAYQAGVYARAYSFLRHREDALDLTQEVILRVIDGIQRFDPDRPLWPWLRRITTNLCLNQLRGRERSASPAARPGEAGEGAEERVPLDASLAGPDDVEGEAESRWLRDRLRAALARLPPLQRMALVLRHEEGRTYEEIARDLDLPLGTVKTYLFRARRQLREWLADELEV